jgi:hypothetical protein
MAMFLRPSLFFLASIGIGAALLTGCAAVRGQESLRQAVASAYGVEAFGRVEQIRFTFNVQLGEKTIRRSWKWEPREDRVTFIPEDGSPERTYERDRLNASGDPELLDIDARFINDQYWLLFPFHLVWDREATVEDRGTAALPIGEGTARRLVVRYPAEGGYTPGDIYEIFVGPDRLLRQWIYRKGGAEEPTRMSTWEDHRRIGPLVLSMDRNGETETFRVWFTNVSLRLAHSDQWIGQRERGEAMPSALLAAETKGGDL